MMFNFDPTIKLGDLLTVAAFLAVGIAAFYRIRGQLDMHGLRLTMIETNVASYATSMEKISVQRSELAVVINRIGNVEADIREMRHGHGFVTGDTPVRHTPRQAT